MRVLAVTHGPDVQAELFGDVVGDHGHKLVSWEIAELGAPPANGYDAAIVFGGKQNVGEEDAHPWLHDEYDALRRWVDEGLPVLGICLGAQTLARAAGAPVTKAKQRQAGFLEIELTEEGRRDPVLGVLPARFPALFGNDYRFEVPAGGVDLATGHGRSQAFRVGRRAWGVQFHPEARRDQALGWLREKPHQRPLEELTAELDAGIARWHEHGRALCEAFLAASQAP